MPSTLPVPAVPPAVTVVGTVSVSVLRPAPLAIWSTPVKVSPSTIPCSVPSTVQVVAPAGPVTLLSYVGSSARVETPAAVTVPKSPPELVPVSVVPFQVHAVSDARPGNESALPEVPLKLMASGEHVPPGVLGAHSAPPE